MILCRPCHDFLHTMMPEAKTGNEEEGRQNWLKFSNAIKVWRQSKQQLFETSVPGGPKELRDAYNNLKKKFCLLTDSYSKLKS